MQDCFDAYTAALFVSDPDGSGSTAILQAVSTLSTGVAPDAVIKKGQGLLGWSFREGEFLHATDFTRDTRTLGIYTEDVGIKALMVAPLEDCLGVLMVDSRSQFAFPQKQQGQFKALARLGGTLVKAYLHEERLGYWERFNRLHPKLSLGPGEALDALLEITGLDVGCIIMLKEKRVFVEHAVPEGITRMNKAIYRDAGFLGGLLRKHRTPVISRRFKALGKRDDSREGLGPSIVAIPVLDGEGVGFALVASGSSTLIGWPGGLEAVIGGTLKNRGDRYGA